MFLDEVQYDEIDPNTTGFITSTNIAYSAPIQCSSLKFSQCSYYKSLKQDNN